MSSIKIEMKEVTDGVLISSDKTIMKVRDPELLSDFLKPYFKEKNRVSYKKIDFGMDKVTVRYGKRKAIFDVEKIKYVKDIGRIDCFLSALPFPGEIDTYPLFVKYRYGWIAIAPLEVV